MEKKMYNHPATEIAEIESLHMIMEGTVSNEPEKPQQGGGGDAGAPARYPQFW